MDMNFQYDAVGNKTREYGTDFDFSYTYDSLNRLTQKTDNDLNKSISYTYDAVGNRITMTDPESEQTTYTYDKLNRLIELENPDNEITEFSYGKMGEKLLQINDNGILRDGSSMALTLNAKKLLFQF